MEREVSGEEYRDANIVSSKRRKSGNNGKYVTMAVVLLAIVSISFFSGVAYGKHHAKLVRGQVSNAGFGGGFGGMRVARQAGTVSAISSTSISVNDSSGTSSTYAITSGTQIIDNGQTVNASDIKTGDTVIIIEDPSSTSQARSIIVNPSTNGGGPTMIESSPTPLQ